MPKFNASVLKKDFLKVAKVAKADSGLEMSSIKVESLRAPHTPTQLPEGKMAVYVFMLGEMCLKVGKVGPKSRARFISQHYNPQSSKSNLAHSYLNDPDASEISGIAEADIGQWIKDNVARYNFLLDSSYGIPVLTLLESFLQCRLKPRYEGFFSQR